MMTLRKLFAGSVLSVSLLVMAPAEARYVESDPIGLQGGMNTYVYAQSNPISRVDPLGLVDWQVSFANGAAGFLDGSLLTATSECVNGNRSVASIGLVGGSVGLDVGGFTTGGFTMSDNNSVPDPNVFNGTYLSANTINIALIVGTQLGSIRIGEARSDYGWGMQFGLAAGALSTAYGKSSVLQSYSLSCSCPK